MVIFGNVEVEGKCNQIFRSDYRSIRKSFECIAGRTPSLPPTPFLQRLNLTFIEGIRKQVETGARGIFSALNITIPEAAKEVHPNKAGRS